MRDALPEYAELHALSNFSFLRGASHPEELITRAAELGYRALALSDECSFAGLVRAHVAAREGHCRLLIGSELTLEDGLKCVLLVTDRRAYGRAPRPSDASPGWASRRRRTAGCGAWPRTRWPGRPSEWS